MFLGPFAGGGLTFTAGGIGSIDAGYGNRWLAIWARIHLSHLIGQLRATKDRLLLYAVISPDKVGDMTRERAVPLPREQPMRMCTIPAEVHGYSFRLGVSAGMPPALLWARHASEKGIRVVGASSLSHDPARDNYPDWTSLPWIGDSDFADALDRCLTEKGIEAVFTPHPVVWSMLRTLLPKLAPHIRLEPGAPWASELSDYRAYREMAVRFDQEPLELAAGGGPEPRMSQLRLAALVRMFQQVPGQCDYAKLEALAAIFRHMPLGDLVEIGSLWGRSAVALAFLAKHYRIGSLLCVDPWRTNEILQGIPEVDMVFGAVPMEEIFEAFCINLWPFAGSVNYARARSEDAALTYRATHSFSTEEFGRTTYTGEIALLHIDGNHAVDAVRSDISAWKPLVRPGGWIVFDDYCWPFGNGPRIAADEFLSECGGSLAAAFVAGGALFAQAGES